MPDPIKRKPGDSKEPPKRNPLDDKDKKAREEAAKREAEIAAQKKIEKKYQADAARGFDGRGKITSMSGKNKRKNLVDEKAGRQGSVHHGKHSVETAGGKLKSPHSMTLGELFNIKTG